MSKQVLITPLPPNALGGYRLAGHTGLLAATLAENSIIYAFQWTNERYQAVIHDVQFYVGVAGAVTTGVLTGVALTPVRDFWNAYTGGTQLNISGVTGHEIKLNAQHQSPLVADVRIATTGALGLPLVPGTLDATDVGEFLFGTGTTAGVVGTVHTSDLLLPHGEDYPLILNAYEGFVIRMSLNGPATGTLRISVATAWYETIKSIY